MASWIVSQDVRQDHLGRTYRQATYPSGKYAGLIFVSAPSADTPKERTIPVREPEVKRPVLRAKKTGGDAKRVAIVEWRIRKTEHVFVSRYEQVSDAQALVDRLRPLVQWTGKDWITVVSGEADYYIQRHEEVDDVA
jgi:hypothetical protein